MPRPVRPPRFDVADNGFYYAYFYDAGKRRTQRESLGTKSPLEAQARFAVWLTQAAPKSIEAPTVSDVLDFYDLGVVEAEIVRQKPIRAIIRHLREALGDMPADAVNATTMQGYIATKLETFANGSVRNQVGTLHAAYVFARKRDFISCPPPAYEAPSPDDPKERWLTVDEIARLIETGVERRREVGDERLLPAEIFIHLGLRTAARSNAIKDLTWDRVDFARRMIDYRSPAWLAMPKHRRSKRRTMVPISDKLLPILERARAESDGSLVLPGRRAVKYDFEKILTAAQLVDVSPHTMRHTWATQASMNGVKMEDIARVMAITVSMAERVYAKYAPDYLRSAVNF